MPDPGTPPLLAIALKSKVKEKINFFHLAPSP
jgi:hypothetical protein